MASKFFRLVALLMIFVSSFSFAAKNKKNKYSIKTSDGGIIAEGRLKQNELEVPAPDSSLANEPAPADSPSLANDPEPVAEEAAPVEEAPAEVVRETEDHKESRYEISAIEEPAEGLNYYITKDENNQYSFVQKLSWNKINDIKNYRITIERSTDAGWVQVMEKDLTENRIEVSLEAGQYRFQVSVINLFDQIEKSSSWRNFEVLKALQPKIENLQTDSMYLSSKKADVIFTLNASGLSRSPGICIICQPPVSDIPVHCTVPIPTPPEVEIYLYLISKGKFFFPGIFIYEINRRINHNLFLVNNRRENIFFNFSKEHLVGQ